MERNYGFLISQSEKLRDYINNEKIQTKETKEMIEKNKNSYSPSTETLKFLGLNTVENLPDYPEINAKLIELISG